MAGLIIPVKNFEEGDKLESEETKEGDTKFKKSKNVKKGKKSKASGARFELRVRQDLEDKEWIVDKWSNNVDLEKKEIVAAKKGWKFNPFRRIMMPVAQGTGFPDFIAFQQLSEKRYEIMGVEVKLNGLLSKQEKEKCKFLLDKKIFGQILIAKKKQIGRRIAVEYMDFKEKYKKLFE